MSSILSREVFLDALSRKDAELIALSLPQGGAISKQNMDRWMTNLLSNSDFHNPYWHYKRLFGIGGSEALACVMYYAQLKTNDPMFDPFTSPIGTFMDKTLMSLPEEPTPRMLRGNRMESHIIDLFVEQFGAVARTDLVDRISAMSGKIEAHPWLVGNPDLVVEMPNGRTYLVDIKAPDEATEFFPFGYTVQLHHYRELAMHAQVKIDGMILGNFDWKEYQVLPLAVPYQPEVVQALLEGGDALWARVCSGDMPDRPIYKQAVHNFTDEEKSAVSDIEFEYLTVHMLESEVSQKKQELSQKLINYMIDKSPDISSMKSDQLGLTMMSLTSRTHINEDAVTSLIRHYKPETAAEDINQLYKIETGYDSTKMAQRLLEMGEDVDQFRLRKMDSKKALESLKELGISKNVARAADIFQEKVMPMYRKPTKGLKKDQHESMKDVAAHVSSLACKTAFTDMAQTLGMSAPDLHQVDAFAGSLSMHVDPEPVISANDCDLSNESLLNWFQST